MQNSVANKRTGCRDKCGFKIPVQFLTSCVTLEKLLSISECTSSSARTGGLFKLDKVS